jgi:hypothetical protein
MTMPLNLSDWAALVKEIFCIVSKSCPYSHRDYKKNRLKGYDVHPREIEEILFTHPVAGNEQGGGKIG